MPPLAAGKRRGGSRLAELDRRASHKDDGYRSNVDPSDDSVEGEIIAVPQRPTKETRDAHQQAQRWAHILPWQVERLRDARLAAMKRQQQVRAEGHYPAEASWPFFEMDAEVHFTLVAARQLLRALKAFDGRDRLPAGLTNAQVRDVRDALEHWDTPGGGKASQQLKKQGASATSHRWSHAGPGVLGDLISDEALARWGRDVYEELSRWDPYDGWRP